VKRGGERLERKKVRNLQIEVEVKKRKVRRIVEGMEVTKKIFYDTKNR
jgi:hypothetical protein